MEAATILLTGFGLAAAAGFNAYVPLLIAGLLVRFTVFELAEPYDLIASTPALLIVTVLLVLEVMADRVPVVHSVNTLIQTLGRPAAGAVLFAGAATAMDPQWPEALALTLGLLAAAGVHAAKATLRPQGAVATGGLAAAGVSTVEDGFAAGLSFAAVLAPPLVIAILAGVVYWFVRPARRMKRTGPPGTPT